MRRPLYSLDRHLEKLLAAWLDQDSPRRPMGIEFVAHRWRDYAGNDVTLRAVPEDRKWDTSGTNAWRERGRWMRASPGLSDKEIGECYK